MNQPENTGKPMTLEVLKNVGGITVDPNAQFTMLDRYGQPTMTTLGDVGTLEDIGRSTGLIKTKSMVRESLEAVKSVEKSSGSGTNQARTLTLNEAKIREETSRKQAQAGTGQIQPLVIEPATGQAQSGTGKDTLVINVGKTLNDIRHGTQFP